MNEYNLDQQIAKIQKQLDEVPALTARLEALKRQKDEQAQRRWADSVEEQNAHRALRSNNATLMLQRAEELVALSQALRTQQNALPSGSSEWLALTKTRNRLYELREALEVKAEQLQEGCEN